MFGNTGGGGSLFGNTGGGGFGGNAGQNTGGLFGKSDAQVQQQANSGGLFGGTNTQQSSMWGNTTNTNQGAGGLFGGGNNQQQQQNSNGVGLFGASNNNNLNNSSIFGGSSFGQQNNTNQGGLFGGQNKTTNSTGIFGNTQQAGTNQQSGGIFGGGQANTSGGLFGGQQQQQGGSLFGGGQQQQSGTGGLFGNTQQSAFGQPNNQQKPQGGFGGSSLFGGSTNQAPGGIFGNTQQQQPNTSGGLFGNQPQQNTQTTGGLFGGASQNQGGLFGAQNTQQQQNPLGQSTIFGQANTITPSFSLGGDNKSSTLGGASWGVNTTQQDPKGKFTAVKSKNPKIDSKHLVKCIVCLDQSFCKNQYRLRYLFTGDPGPTSQPTQTQSTNSWSGQNQQQSTWGSQQNQSNLWGTTGASTTNSGLNFNKPATGGGGSLFGGTTSTSGGLFGGTTNTTGGPFGGTTNTSGGLFGGGGTTNTSGGLFGGSSGGFGTTTQQNTTNPGGANLFGTFANTNTTANQWNSPTLNRTTGGLFNTAPNQNAPTSSAFGGTSFGGQNTGNTGGLFGATNTANTGGGLFGTQNTGGGLFGGQPQNTANTGGGGLFGAQNTGGGLFGNQNAGATGGGLFGAQTNTGGNSLFGGQNTGGSLFGNTQSGLFGTQNPAGNTNVFGSNFQQPMTGNVNPSFPGTGQQIGSSFPGTGQQIGSSFIQQSPQFPQNQNSIFVGGHPQNTQNLLFAGLQPLMNNQQTQDNSQLLNAILALTLSSNPNLINTLKTLIPNMSNNIENSLLLPSKDPFSNYYDQNMYKSKVVQRPNSTLFSNESLLQQKNQRDQIEEYKRKKQFIDQMNIDTPLFGVNSLTPQEVIKKNSLETPFNLLMQAVKNNNTDKSATPKGNQSSRIIEARQLPQKTFYTDFRTIPEIDRLNLNRNEKHEPEIKVIKNYDQKYLNRGVDMSKYKYRMNAKPHHLDNYRKDNLVSMDELPLDSNFKLKPSIKQLQQLTQEEIKRVNNVQISNQYGKIRFIGPINLYKKQLYKCIKIEQDCIEILIPEWQNKSCYLTYYNFGNYKQKGQEQRRKIVKKMRKWCMKNKLRLQEFDESTGKLQVRVDAFTV